MATQSDFIKTQRRANIYPSEAVPKIAEEGTLPNSFYKATIAKPDKDTTKKRKKITGQYH